MKTSKITTTIAALNLVLFMSLSSIANPLTGKALDGSVKSSNNQIESVKSTFTDDASSSTSDNEFSHLRFDVNKFNIENYPDELPVNSLNYLRFDANTYSDGNSSEITELPSMTEFSYLRFDATKLFDSSESIEMPTDEFDYLHFDHRKFSNETSSEIDELPVK